MKKQKLWKTKVCLLAVSMLFALVSELSVTAWAAESPDLSKLNKIDLSGAIAISSSRNGLGASAHTAFDGDPNTRWAADGPDLPQSLMVDLGAVKNIAKINTLFEQQSTWEYKIKYSVDGGTWKIYAEKTGGVIKHQSYTDENNVEARYVSIEITGAGLDPNGEKCWASIWEFEVIEKGTGINLALNQPSTATSTVDAGASAAAAFDNNPETRWCADDESMPQWLMADLGGTAVIREIYINFEQSSDWNFVLETSLDGVNWNQYAAKNESGQKFYLEGNQSGRYVRITVNRSTGGAWASIWDLDVYTSGQVVPPAGPVETPSSWAAQNVADAIAAGLVPTVLQKNYAKPVSRGDVAQMFINLIEKGSGMNIDAFMTEKGAAIDSGVFTDTTDQAVLAANALGIISGVGGGKFDPSGTLTRAQAAAIINRVAHVLGVETSGYTHSFTDVSGHWADAELGWPVHAGVISGVGNNKFDPDGKLTAEQAIAITYRALQSLK